MSEGNDQRRSKIRAAWLRWVALWIPLMAAVGVASSWLDFDVIMALLIALLVAVLLYQRLINKRSWSSIMWGVHEDRE